jgi:hypothetical protein
LSWRHQPIVAHADSTTWTIDEALDIVAEDDPRIPWHVIHRLDRRGSARWL